MAAIPKMLFPAIVTVQGMLALAVAPSIVKHDYNLALPTLMGRYYHSGMLGLGSDGAAGQLHVRDGRQHYGLQYGIHL